MGADDAVLQGRDAYERRAWGEAYARLSAADEQGQLGAEDLGRLGMAAYLTGRIEPAVAAWERTYQALMECGEVTRAVRCAFWLGRTLVLRGEQARGGGWLVRAQRVLEEASLDCVERGYLRMPAGIMALEGGDPATAYATFAEVTEIADRFGDADLMAIGRMAQGRALVASSSLAPTREVDVRAEVAALHGIDPGDLQSLTSVTVPQAQPAAVPPLRLRQPVDLGGGLYVAGDHRDTPSIQGAMASGARAARAVLRALHADQRGAA